MCISVDLPGARRAHDRGEAAGGEVDGDAGEGVDRGLALAVAAVQVGGETMSVEHDLLTPAAPVRHDSFGRGESGAQVGEHREHAAVVVWVGGSPSFPKMRRDVLLDGALGDDELLGDRVVRAALGHQPEHLALARR